jgi:hypothetical protein
MLSRAGISGDMRSGVSTDTKITRKRERSDLCWCVFGIERRFDNAHRG